MKILKITQMLAKIGVLGVVKMLMLIVTIVAARLLDQDALAEFLIYLSIVGLGGVVAGLGLDQYWVRLSPMLNAQGRQAELFGLACVTGLIASLGSVVFVGVMIALGITPGLETVWSAALLALAVLGGFFRRLAQYVMLIEGHRVLSLIMGGGLFYCLIMAAALVPGWSSLVIISVSSILSGAASAALVFLHLHRLRGDRPKEPTAPAISVITLVRTAFPSLVNQLGGHMLQQGGVLFMATVASSQEINRYGIAIRMTYALTVVPEVIGLLFGKEIAQHAVSSDIALKRKTILTLWGYSLAMCLGISAVFVFFGESLIELLFGLTFVSAYPVLLILTFGKLFSSTFGVSPLFFTSAGLSKPVAGGMFVAVVAFAALSWVLVPQIAAIGLALSTTAALLLISLNSIHMFFKLKPGVG